MSQLPNSIDEKSFDENGDSNVKVNTLVTTASTTVSTTVFTLDVKLVNVEVTKFITNLFNDPSTANLTSEVQDTIKLINSQAATVVSTINTIFSDILDDNKLDITEVPKLVLLVNTLVTGELKALISSGKLQSAHVIGVVKALFITLVEKSLIAVESNEQVVKLFESSVALLKGAANIKDEISKLEEFITNLFTGKNLDLYKLNLDPKVEKLITLINTDAKNIIKTIHDTIKDVLHDGKLDASDVPKLVLLITTLMNSDLKKLITSGQINLDDIVGLLKNLLQGLIDNSLMIVDNAESMFKLFDASLMLLQSNFEVPSMSSITACCVPIFAKFSKKA